MCKIKLKIFILLIALNITYSFGNEWSKKEMIESCSNSNINECINRGIKFEENKNYKKAYVYYITACKSRNASACYNIGRLFQYGLGMKKSIKDALRYYEYSCDNNSPKACQALGHYYATNKTNQDLDTAFSYFNTSCKLGEASACGQVAWSYKKGIGTKQSWKNASIYYDNACNGGNDAIACAGYAGLFLKGNGVRYDKKEALRLFDKACKLGFTKMCSNSKYIRSHYNEF